MLPMHRAVNLDLQLIAMGSTSAVQALQIRVLSMCMRMH